MQKYLVINRSPLESEQFSVNTTRADSLSEAVMKVLTDEQIRDDDWSVYEIDKSVNKEDYVADGLIDDMVGDGIDD